MNIHEYQAKKILKQYGAPTPKGVIVSGVDEIKNKIKKLKINEFSDPIKIPNGYLIVKLNNKKVFDQKIDVEKELKKLIEYETNRQLNNFSIIFYKRLKQNTEIDEY